MASSLNLSLTDELREFVNSRTGDEQTGGKKRQWRSETMIFVANAASCLKRPRNQQHQCVNGLPTKMDNAEDGPFEEPADR